MTRTALILATGLALAAALPACGTPGAWKHKNKNIAEFYGDDQSCRGEARKAIKGDESQGALAMDEGVYAGCMKRKGWERKK